MRPESPAFLKPNCSMTRPVLHSSTSPRATSLKRTSPSFWGSRLSVSASGCRYRQKWMLHFIFNAKTGHNWLTHLLSATLQVGSVLPVPRANVQVGSFLLVVPMPVDDCDRQQLVFQSVLHAVQMVKNAATTRLLANTAKWIMGNVAVAALFTCAFCPCCDAPHPRKTVRWRACDPTWPSCPRPGTSSAGNRTARRATRCDRTNSGNALRRRKCWCPPSTDNWAKMSLEPL